jgi:hypothetical protein
MGRCGDSALHNAACAYRRSYGSQTGANVVSEYSVARCTVVLWVKGRHKIFVLFRLSISKKSAEWHSIGIVAMRDIMHEIVPGTVEVIGGVFRPSPYAANTVGLQPANSICCTTCKAAQRYKICGCIGGIHTWQCVRAVPFRCTVRENRARTTHYAQNP